MANVHVAETTCHVASFENLQIPVQRTCFDDSPVAFFVVPICGTEDDVVSDSSMLEPCL